MSALAIMVPDMPAMTRELAWVAERVGLGQTVSRRYDTPTMQGDARMALQTATAAAVRATPDVIVQWMEMIALSVSNPPTGGERRARVSFVIDSCGDLPMGCWTRKTRSQFMLRGPDARFWPTEVEVDGFLRPIGNRLHATARGIEALAVGTIWTAPPALPAPAETEQEPSEADIQAVHAKVEEALAAMNTARAPEMVRLRPVRLGGRALWESRNAARSAAGIPLLPEPDSFEGYGT